MLQDLETSIERSVVQMVGERVAAERERQAHDEGVAKATLVESELESLNAQLEVQQRRYHSHADFGSAGGVARFNHRDRRAPGLLASHRGDLPVQIHAAC